MADGIRAVYVEDEPSVRAMLIKVLELSGIEVTLACSSAEEMLAHRGAPEFSEAHVLIFDVRLPGISGLDLAALLRVEGEDRPIVAVSAWPAPSEEELDRFRITFVQKPFMFADLEKRVRYLVENHRKAAS